MRQVVHAVLADVACNKALLAKLPETLKAYILASLPQEHHDNDDDDPPEDPPLDNSNTNAAKDIPNGNTEHSYVLKDQYKYKNTYVPRAREKQTPANIPEILNQPPSVLELEADQQTDALR